MTTYPLLTPGSRASEAEVAGEYISRFAGREDAYLRRADNWYCAREPLTPEVVATAFGRALPIGFYFVPPSGLTQAGALDFDEPDGLAIAHLVAEVLEEGGVIPYLEASRRGAHLWIVLDRKIGASLWARAFGEVLRRLELTDRKIDAFPAGPLTQADSVGRALRGPMLPHPETGLAYPLTRPSDGSIVGESVEELVGRLQLTRAGTLQSFAGEVSSARPPSRQAVESSRFIKAFKARYSITDVLAQAGLKARPGQSIRCPFHDDQHASFAIASNDRRCWCNAGGCLFHNGRLGHDSHDLSQTAKRLGLVAGGGQSPL